MTWLSFWVHKEVSRHSPRRGSISCRTRAGRHRVLPASPVRNDPRASYLILETSRLLQIIREKTEESLKSVIFWKSQNLGNRHFNVLKNREIRLSLFENVEYLWDQDLSKNINMELVRWDQYLSKRHETET